MWSPGGVIGFQADEEANYLGNSFGLPNLYNLKPGTYVGQDTFQNTLTTEYTTTAHEKQEYENVLEAIPETDGKDYIEEPADIQATNPRGRLFTIVGISLLLLSAATTYFLFTDQNPLNLFGSSAEEVSENTTDGEEDAEEELIQDTQLYDFEGDEMVEVDQDPNANTEESTQEESTPVEETPRNTNEDFSNYDGSRVVDYATNNTFINSFAYNPNPPSNLNAVMIRQPNSRFYVVLGSFKEQANAFSFYNNLLNRGIQTAKIISPNGKNTYYRVSYQDFGTVQEAERQEKHLENNETYLF